MIGKLLLSLTLLFAAQTGNNNDEVTISGAISSIEQLSNFEGIHGIMRIEVVTEEGIVQVYLGPAVSLSHSEIPIRQDDRVEVTGTMSEVNGLPVMVASSLRRGRYKIELQNEEKVPLWEARPLEP